MQEDLLDVDIKQELRTNFYPRIKDISTAVEAMQYEVRSLCVRCDAEPLQPLLVSILSIDLPHRCVLKTLWGSALLPVAAIV